MAPISGASQLGLHQFIDHAPRLLHVGHTHHHRKHEFHIPEMCGPEDGDDLGAEEAFSVRKYASPCKPARSTVFDHGGTLRFELPMCFQANFILD